MAVVVLVSPVKGNTAQNGLQVVRNTPAIHLVPV